MSAIGWICLCLVLLVGVPHGAADGAMGSKAWTRRWGPAAGMALFIAAYIGIAALAFAAWSALPALTLFTLFILAAFHFGEQEQGWQRVLRGSLPILLPALLWPVRLEALLVPLIGDIAGETVIAARLIGLGGLIAGGYVAIRKRAWRAEILINLLVPPPFGFAVYFILLHSIPELRRQARKRRVSVRSHLADFAPFALAAIALLAVLVFPSEEKWPLLLLGLLCLAVPHMIMPNITQLLAQNRMADQSAARS